MVEFTATFGGFLILIWLTKVIKPLDLNFATLVACKL